MHDAATDALSATFAALADPTRRAILARLARGEAPVGELVKPFPISGPAVSRHLRVLEHAQLIERKADAQWRICRLHAPGLQRANDWLSQYRAFWDDSLNRLVDVLEQSDAQTSPTAAPHQPDTGTTSAPQPNPQGHDRAATAPTARRTPIHNRRKKP